MHAHRLLTPQPVEENPLIIADLPIPTPGPRQVRLKVHVCGVCHTDLHMVEGDIHPPRLPLTPGHQVIGIVDALGEGVRAVNIGDRLGIPWLHTACEKCAFCCRGEENLCRHARFTGFDVDGGFAEYLLAEACFALPIPAAISDEQAAPLMCAGIIGYRSLHKADLQPGERLGLVGFGASAHLAIQVALHWGCEVCVFTRSPAHRQHARDLGALWAGGIEETPPTGWLDRAVIFAPAGDLIPATLEKIRPGGTVAINAIHLTPIPSMPYDLIYGERTLRSVANATYRDGVEFLELAAKISIAASVNLYPFADANRALLDLKHSQINGEAVLCMV